MSPAKRFASFVVVGLLDLAFVIVAIVGSSLFKSAFIVLAAGVLTLFVIVFTKSEP